MRPFNLIPSPVKHLVLKRKKEKHQRPSPTQFNPYNIGLFSLVSQTSSITIPFKIKRALKKKVTIDNVSSWWHPSSGIPCPFFIFIIFTQKHLSFLETATTINVSDRLYKMLNYRIPSARIFQKGVNVLFASMFSLNIHILLDKEAFGILSKNPLKV